MIEFGSKEVKLTPEFIKFIACSIVSEMDIHESAALAVSIMMDAWSMPEEEFYERISLAIEDRKKS